MLEYPLTKKKKKRERMLEYPLTESAPTPYSPVADTEGAHGHAFGVGHLEPETHHVREVDCCVSYCAEGDDLPVEHLALPAHAMRGEGAARPRRGEGAGGGQPEKSPISPEKRRYVRLHSMRRA